MNYFIMGKQRGPELAFRKEILIIKKIGKEFLKIFLYVFSSHRVTNIQQVTFTDSYVYCKTY